MATAKKRINITLTDAMEYALALVAKRDNMPQATKAVNLLRFALELEEDMVWNQIASKRDSQKAKFISHAKAWTKRP
ncbi:MAG: hypothetical protein HY482_01325 [Candidatus Wildermuthbacteria bacterium]|nr:hypothetical protein [Candidatus Wildermuthbacteria bacterium]